MGWQVGATLTDYHNHTKTKKEEEKQKLTQSDIVFAVDEDDIQTGQCTVATRINLFNPQVSGEGHLSNTTFQENWGDKGSRPNQTKGNGENVHAKMKGQNQK